MKKILSIVLAVLLFFLSAISAGAFVSKTVGGRVNVLSSMEGVPGFSSIENLSITFYIGPSGAAALSFSVSNSIKSPSQLTITSYIEKRSLGVFWSKVDIGVQDDQWVERTSKKFYSATHAADVSEDGVYRATVKVTGRDGETVTKTALFEYVADASRGDVNFDGRITAADARIVLRYSAKLESLDSSQIERADMNYDDNVASSDARIILRISAGLL